jgi:hypothetical protein
MCQPCFASKAKLKHSISRKPIPPLSFCRPICPQFIQATFLSFSLCPHQKRDIIELISLHRVFGNWNTLIVYVGIACITALRRISFPAWERNFSFHPLIRSQIFPFMSVKVLTLDFPTKAGRPRYFSYCCDGSTPAIEAM